MHIPGGWSKTPHIISEAMEEMSWPELVCTNLLVRETFGWHRRRARITSADFIKRTPIKSRATVTSALNAVAARGFFQRTARRCVWQIGAMFDVDEEEPEGSAADQSAAPQRSAADHKVDPQRSTVDHKSEAQRSAIDHKNEPKRSTTDQFLNNKEKGNPAGQERERERKETTIHNLPPATPHPRSAKERAIAAHPAVPIWLELNLNWPGWKRLKLITRRLGPQPDKVALARACELWLMAGYREDNAGGILDWYDQLCRNPTWTPHAPAAQASAPNAQGAAHNPTMAMLQRIRDERLQKVAAADEERSYENNVNC